MKLRYEHGALADLDEIFAYIAADKREAAGRLVARIEHEAELRVAPTTIIVTIRCVLKPIYSRFGRILPENLSYPHP